VALEIAGEADGGFAQYVAVDAANAHDVQDSPLSDEQLACLPVAFGTATGMLERANVHDGETVLVTGASGGVGLALVQLAAARGAHVLAITSGSKGDAVLANGAAQVFNRDSADLISAVKAAAPGGLDVVADIAGGPGLAAMMPMLRDNGRWVIAGAVAGPVVEFDLRRLYLHNVQLIGSSMHTRVHFRRLVELARGGHVRPQVSSTFALADIAQAQEEFSAHRHVGKIVIRPDSCKAHLLSAISHDTGVGRTSCLGQRVPDQLLHHRVVRGLVMLDRVVRALVLDDDVGDPVGRPGEGLARVRRDHLIVSRRDDRV